MVELDLCPFARSPLQSGRLRFRVSEATGARALKLALGEELDHLLSAPADEWETSLVIHPNALLDFSAFNDFLDTVEELLHERELVGTVQVASFHPDYLFGGCPADDAANYTNRSPYPMLHLIRESSMDAAARQHPDLEGIPDRNMAKLRALGLDDVKKRLAACREVS